MGAWHLAGAIRTNGNSPRFVPHTIKPVCGCYIQVPPKSIFFFNLCIFSARQSLNAQSVSCVRTGKKAHSSHSWVSKNALPYAEFSHLQPAHMAAQRPTWLVDDQRRGADCESLTNLQWRKRDNRLMFCTCRVSWDLLALLLLFGRAQRCQIGAAVAWLFARRS
jgi:hypothetical protein